MTDAHRAPLPSPSPVASVPSAARDRALLAVVQLVLLAPFIDKAIHLDDAFFLAIARHIASAPLEPFGFDYNWAGTTAPVWAEMKNPPGVFYVLALLVQLAGEGERWLHAAFWIFPLAASQLVYSLARRVSDAPLYASLLLIASPAYWVSATSLMIDVPLVSALLAALVCAVLASERGGIGWPLAAGAAASFAVLAKYFGLVVVPLLGVFVVLHGRRRPVDGWMVALPILAFAGWWWASDGHVLQAVGYRAEERADWWSWLATHGVAASTFTAGLLGFPVAMLGAALLGPGERERGLGSLALGLGIAAGLLTVFVFPGLPTVALALTALLAASFAVFAVVLLGRPPDDALARVLWCWLGGALVFAVVFNWTLNARTVLLLAPPAAVLFTRWSTGRPRLRLAALAGTAVLGSAVVSADAELAEFGRAEAQRVAETVAGERIRFAGHWGFQYYMERAGYRHVELDRPDLRAGDVVIAPVMHQVANGGIPSLASGRVTQLDRARRIPLAVMDSTAGAGLHGSFLGPLPFAFTRGRLEQVEVLRW